ncbi:DNA-binding protein [Pseudomonas syringae]|uniref:DNA-binding protein n=1 Tax=Pseudomonas syringae TaxID=317 RepID=UPI000209916B|nr:DNA-binding protein [Pseudomonas syringae]MDP5168567.1 DNA-binding protein [Pseudomonas syringae pv. aptata str. DSM 50252]
MDSSINGEIRGRIWAAAEYLYDQAGRGDAKPTVDAVRRHAKANMNDVSLVMKEWREAQKVAVKSVAVEVPESLAIMGSQTLVVLWQTAQELANESLRAAQAGWDMERMEADALTRQISQAFDDQTGVLDGLEVENQRLDASCVTQASQIDALSASVTDLTARLAEATSDARQASVRVDEIQARANELRAELDHAHALAEKTAGQAERDRAEQNKLIGELKAELDQSRQTHATELGKYQERIESLSADRSEARNERDHVRFEANQEREQHMAEIGKLNEKVANLLIDRDEARKDRTIAQEESRIARENAAKLEGRLEMTERTKRPKATTKAITEKQPKS